MMDLRWKNSPIFLSTLILTTIVTVQGSPTNSILLNDLKHLNMNRHHVTNPSGKALARNYIRDTLTSLGLHTWTEQFNPRPPYRYPYDGINIVGVLPGRQYKTIYDRLILIGAHYDTMRDTKGIDDDASGLVVMLQVARSLTKKSSSCTREYSVMFVAFDFEEWEDSTVSGCACAELGCGSRAFVSNFSRYYNLLPKMYVAIYGQLRGAIIMDTMMNYNSAPNSQTVPHGLEGIFPQQYQSVLQNENRGDFLLASGRYTDDIYLLNTFEYFYHMKGREEGNKYKLQVFPLPFDGQTRNLHEEYRRRLSPFLRGDHVSFWNSITSYRAIFLSDTANMRSYMRDCYHENCDTLRHVTIDVLGFLSKSRDTIVMTTDHLTLTRCRSGKRSSHDDGLTGGAIGGIASALGVVAFGGAAAWTYYRRRSSDPNVLVENDQLEEGRSDVITPQSETCEDQESTEA